jgi:hypothetical protein
MAEEEWDEMRDGFGTVPYRGYRYGPVSHESKAQISAKLREATAEPRRLRLILELLKKGDWSARDLLVPMLESPYVDVRMYAAELFAYVCTHDQVNLLKKSLVVAQDLDEVMRVILFIGETLSTRAAQLLWTFREEMGGEYQEFSGYIHSALTDILSLDGVDEYSLDEPSARQVFDLEIMTLDPTKYYYGGKPVFIGDLTKEVITYAAIARTERTKFALVDEPRVLSNFSGINCPVGYGRSVDDDGLGAVLKYTHQIGQMKLDKGMKYFYGHPVGR